MIQPYNMVTFPPSIKEIHSVDDIPKGTPISENPKPMIEVTVSVRSKSCLYLKCSICSSSLSFSYSRMDLMVLGMFSLKCEYEVEINGKLALLEGSKLPRSDIVSDQSTLTLSTRILSAFLFYFLRATYNWYPLVHQPYLPRFRLLVSGNRLSTIFFLNFLIYKIMAVNCVINLVHSTSGNVKLRIN